ncbi:MAG: flagellin [Cyanobacteria bacterium]|nr:flagellin [Cyanobacteriota bacterium]MDA1020341.1 flagellin [Cyanobacteriota bacterium]
MLTGISFNSFSTVFGNAYNQTNRTLGQAIERLSSGLRINGAADDVANTARIQSLTSSIRGYEVAERNLGDGVSLIRTAEAGLGSIQTELQEIRSLAVQANNDTLGTVEKQAIQSEIDSRLSNIDDISGGSSFNGIKLLDASAGTLNIQTGTDSGDTDSIDLSGSFDSASANAAGNINEGNGGGALGEALNNIDVVTGNLDDIITGLDNAIDNVAAAQSSLGAKENAFVSKSQSMSGSREAALATRSRLRDADFARETSIAVRGFILRSSTVAMSSQRQANASLALTLLPMVR